MRYRIVINLFAVAGLLASMSTGAVAQTWSPEQLVVWEVIEAQWQASMEKNEAWPNRFLHDQFRGWANENPAPRDKGSTERWTRYTDGNSNGGGTFPGSPAPARAIAAASSRPNANASSPLFLLDNGFDADDAAGVAAPSSFAR